MESKSLCRPARSTRRLIVVASFATAAFLMGVVPSLASASSFDPRPTNAAQVRKTPKLRPETRTVAQKRLMRRGYLVPHQAQYDRRKARITRRAASSQTLTTPVSTALTPSTLRAWQGINDTDASPPDETSSVGTTRYIETVNDRFAIYNKTSNAPMSTGTLNSLWGTGSSSGFTTDPQIMWDATTNRFYYAGLIIPSRSHNVEVFGFSKTASPSSAADFCHYFYDFGKLLPDYPKLGDSRFFGEIGSNVFTKNGSFVGSDLAAFKKPPAGTGCPTTSSLKITDAGPLLLPGRTRAFTPVPANEIDNDAVGWTVSTAITASSTKLGLFKVTRSSTGAPVIQRTGSNATVPRYTVPPNAPQKGSVHRIDTSDGRNTQAVAAVDPGHNNRLALWTQHTVKGGAGAQVRWYELDPAAHSVLQKGTVTSGSLFEFNGAISPNRQVNGAIKRGGNAMLMNFNSSSARTFPSINMVSKVGAAAQSGQVSVLNGTHPVGGFDCDATAPCRWGDYAAATPDPSTANRIWNVSQYGNGRGNFSNRPPSTSKTWNFIARP
jgi:hypothetical protein